MREASAATEPATAKSAGPSETGETRFRESEGGRLGAGISQFLAQVLEQLSISSWFPAAMLVGNAAVLFQVHDQTDFSISAAVQDLIDQHWGALIVLLFALILTTIALQAFEFEVIRLLEGYVDVTRGPLPLLLGLRTSRHETKAKRFEESYTAATIEAFESACPALLSDPHNKIDSRHLDVIRATLNGATKVQAKPAVVAKAAELDWSKSAQPKMLYSQEAARARVAAYPRPHRILPTRLGNALRASEDQVRLGSGESLEGYVLRHHDSLPRTLRNEHDDYRARMDMYCTLVLVFVTLMVMAAWAVSGPGHLPNWGQVAIPLGYASLGWMAYEAAIASARGYGAVLVEIDAFVRRQLQRTEMA